MDVNVDVSLMTDAELSALVAQASAVLLSRAVERGDVAALIDSGFADLFRARELTPVLRDGLLIAPGVKVEKSRSSHDCTYLSVDGMWVWEHPDAIADERRPLSGPKPRLASVTIVPVLEGTAVDVVTSRSRGGGPCRMTHATSYVVDGATLSRVSTRRAQPAPGAH